MTSTQAGLATGATLALLTAVAFKAPLWASVLAFAGAALVTKKAIDATA
jgi:hypothetical protein